MTKLNTTLLLFVLASFAATAQQKPNILVIFGDDVGVMNISAYSQGLMGYIRPTLIASAGRERCFFIIMVNKVAPPVAQHFLPANTSFARV